MLIVLNPMDPMGFNTLNLEGKIESQAQKSFFTSFIYINDKFSGAQNASA